MYMHVRGNVFFYSCSYVERGVVDASNAGRVFKKTWRLALPDSPVPAGLTVSGVRYGAVISTATSEPCHQE